MWGLLVFVVCVAGISASAETLPATETQGSRIVSGWQAAEGQFPYMLYVRGITIHGDIGFCAGSIIHRSWGLSAGRCTARRAHLIISGGMVNLNRPRFLLETSTVLTPPGFVEDLWQLSQPHDLALIGFNRELAFDFYVQPIRIQRLADMRRDYSDVKMVTSGWGTTWTGGQASENLNWVNLRGVHNTLCALWHNSNWLVQETAVCAGFYNVTSQSICSGDNGAPLVIEEVDGSPTQIGVGSFVHFLGCHLGMPAGFTRTGFYHDFIRSVTGINFDW